MLVVLQWFTDTLATSPAPGKLCPIPLLLLASDRGQHGPFGHFSLSPTNGFVELHNGGTSGSWIFA